MVKPGPGVQLSLRSFVAFSALFTGGSIVHKFFGPDLASRAIPCASHHATHAPATTAIGPAAPVCRQTVPALASGDDKAGTKVEGFTSASAFQGARPGFVFKQGSEGLGYYPDNHKKR